MNAAATLEDADLALISAREVRNRAEERLRDWDNRIRTAEREIKQLEDEYPTVLGNAKKRDSLRSKLRSVRTDLEDLKRERSFLERTVDEALAAERHCFADQQVLRRMEIQRRGREVAEEMARIVKDLGLTFRQWQELRERDRLVKDIINSQSPERVNDTVTFSYATAMDDTYAGAVAQVVAEAQRNRPGPVTEGASSA